MDTLSIPGERPHRSQDAISSARKREKLPAGFRLNSDQDQDQDLLTDFHGSTETIAL